MRIGLTLRKQIINQKDSYVVYERYIKLLSNCEIIMINDTQSEEVIDMCDGFIITGGDDVDPNLYFQENINSNGICYENDKLDLMVIEHAYKNNKPLLGICRGIQILNVYFKGTLKQHYDGHMNTVHKLVEVIKPRLFEIKNKIVNSYHHQIIDVVGNELVVTYKSSDGIVEVIEHVSKNIIAVQYHPEISTNSDDIQLYNMLFNYTLK